jgi:hypothetical protein
MIQRIIATLIIAVLYFFVAIQGTLQAGAAEIASLNQAEEVAGSELSGVLVVPTGLPLRDTSTEPTMLVPISSSVAQFNDSKRSWSFSAKVIQLKNVSIYGQPGMIAQIEFSREGEARHGWVVVQIDDYHFANGTGALRVGQDIVLETAGPHVSSVGVNWDACPSEDPYCRYAGFIEGGFPTSEDYNGLTICPSNGLIYSGDASSDWINGMLAWKIKIID